MTPCEKAGIPMEDWCEPCRITTGIENMRAWLEVRGLEPTS